MNQLEVLKKARASLHVSQVVGKRNQTSFCRDHRMRKSHTFLFLAITRTRMQTPTCTERYGTSGCYPKKTRGTYMFGHKSNFSRERRRHACIGVRRVYSVTRSVGGSHRRFLGGLLPSGFGFLRRKRAFVHVCVSDGVTPRYVATQRSGRPHLRIYPPRLATPPHAGDISQSDIVIPAGIHVACMPTSQ